MVSINDVKHVMPFTAFDVVDILKKEGIVIGLVITDDVRLLKTCVRYGVSLYKVQEAIRKSFWK